MITMVHDYEAVYTDNNGCRSRGGYVTGRGSGHIV